MSEAIAFLDTLRLCKGDGSLVPRHTRPRSGIHMSEANAFLDTLCPVQGRWFFSTQSYPTPIGHPYERSECFFTRSLPRAREMVL